MRVFCGKLADVCQSASIQASSTRVPIVTVNFQPRVPYARDGQVLLERLLTGGGSAVTLWGISVLDAKQDDVTDAPTPQLPDSTTQHEDPALSKIRLLHAKACAKRLSSTRIGLFPDHSPEYLIRVEWSPDGTRWASADARQLLIWGQKTVVPETWVRQTSIIEPAISEIFDFCWVDDSRIALGGIERVVIRPVAVCGSTKPSLLISLPDCSITKGMVCRTVTPSDTWPKGASILAVSTNIKKAFVFSIENQADGTPKSSQLVGDSELFLDGPLDTPLLRHCSIDPTGILAAFSFGERHAQCFGAIYHLGNMSAAEQVLKVCSTGEETDIVKQANEIIHDSKFRARGHQSRINAVAFGNCCTKLNITPLDFLSASKPFASDDQGDSAAPLWRSICKAAKNCGTQVFENLAWPRRSRYAQASVEGTLSVWDIFPSNRVESLLEGREIRAPPSGLCLFSTPTSLVDQTGLISDLAWSWDDSILAVASDDGKLTCFYFEEESPPGPLVAFANEQFLQNSCCPPRVPHKVEETSTTISPFVLVTPKTFAEMTPPTG